jgi:hypothetical protein
MATDETEAPSLSDGSPGAVALEDKFKQWDKESKRHQKSRLSFVKAVIFVGPIAVTLLTLQAIVFRDGPAAAWLIFGEMVLLLVAVAVPFLKFGRSHGEWINARVRAEVLRREQCLLLAQVGPYLNKTPAEAANEVERRIAILGRPLDDASELLTSTRAPASWRNELEEANRLGNGRELHDVRPRARQYLENRVKEQESWFSKKSHDHETTSRCLERTAHLILTLALALAAVHLGILWRNAFEPSDVHPWWESPLEIAALCLPAFGAAVIAYRSALGSQRQALSYHYHADSLVPFRSAVQAIAVDDEKHEDVSLHFKRLVLDVEEVLSDELRQWWMNMVIKEPHTTA